MSQRDKITNILIANLGHLGEMVLSTALIANIRDIFPQAQLTLLGGQWATPIMEDSRLIDRIMVYNSNSHNRGATKKLTLLEIINVMRELKRRKIDLIYDLRSDYWILLYTIISHPAFRIDFGSVRARSHWRDIHSVPTPTRIVHYCLQYLDMVNELRPGEKKTKLRLETNADAAEWVESKLMYFGINAAAFVVVIHPFAEWKGREWGISNFAKVGDFLCSRYNAKVIITGRKEDKERALEIEKLMSTKAYNLAGDTTIKTLTALISEADLVICNDGGPMHIAAALNIPLVALFGPQTPLLFGPWSENSRVIYHELDCSPCRQRYCKKSLSCMELIQVGEVVTAVEELCGSS